MIPAHLIGDYEFLSVAFPGYAIMTATATADGSQWNAHIQSLFGATPRCMFVAGEGIPCTAVTVIAEGDTIDAPPLEQPRVVTLTGWESING
jgi:hypothetical protein